MSNPRQAKTCPQCGTMTLLDSKACAICGREYRSTTEAPAPVSELHRTQMMTLPPPVMRPDRERVPPAEEDLSRFEPDAPRARLNGPAILMAVVIALLLFVMVWWFAHQL